MIQTNLTSNSKGVVKVSDLSPGEYDLVELKAPTGYILNTVKTAFTITQKASGEPKTLQLADQINYRGSVEFTKINSNYTPLKGAEFTLYDRNNKKLDVFTSDKNGKMAIADLAPGDYHLVETKAPLKEDGNPYVRNNYPLDFTIASKANGKVATKDLGYYQNFRGKLVLTKRDGDGGAPLGGAVFELYRLGNKDAIGTTTTDKNGALDYGDLASGSYKLIEIKAPKGYVVNNNPIYFVVNPTDDKDTEDHFTFENFQASIEFNKVNQYGDKLNDAEFKILQVTDARDAVVNKTVAEHLTSDQAGKYEYKGLEEGTYELIETKAATGYILNTVPVKFTIGSVTNKPLHLNLQDVVNYQGEVSFKKTDDAGKELSGAEFQLMTKDGKDVVDKDNKKMTATADKNGKVDFNNLAPGEYRIKETKAPDGYLLNETEVSFSIKASDKGNPKAIQLPNFVNYKGAVQLTKVAAEDTNHVLSNAVFKLTDASGKAVKEELQTDEKGEITINGLAPGRYQFIETNAPDGYQLSNQSYQVVVPEKANQKPERVTLMVTNKKKESTVQPKEPKSSKNLPQTGEKVMTPLWGGVILLALSSIIGLKFKSRKN